ncbi:hypothetical protein D3C80_1483000 [compost metagenome]
MSAPALKPNAVATAAVDADPMVKSVLELKLSEPVPSAFFAILAVTPVSEEKPLTLLTTSSRVSVAAMRITELPIIKSPATPTPSGDS